MKKVTIYQAESRERIYLDAGYHLERKAILEQLENLRKRGIEFNTISDEKRVCAFFADDKHLTMFLMGWKQVGQTRMDTHDYHR